MLLRVHEMDRPHRQFRKALRAPNRPAQRAGIGDAHPPATPAASHTGKRGAFAEQFASSDTGDAGRDATKTSRARSR